MHRWGKLLSSKRHTCLFSQFVWLCACLYIRWCSSEHVYLYRCRYTARLEAKAEPPWQHIIHTHTHVSTQAWLAAEAERKWQPNSASHSCQLCNKTFSSLRWRHHCRKCGKLVCNACSKYPHPLNCSFIFEILSRIPCPLILPNCLCRHREIVTECPRGMLVFFNPTRPSRVCDNCAGTT